jgi:hypothetical protein
VPPLEGIVQRHLRLEEITHRQEKGGDEIRKKDRPGRLIEPHGLILSGVTGLATRSNRSLSETSVVRFDLTLAPVNCKIAATITTMANMKNAA